MTSKDPRLGLYDYRPNGDKYDKGIDDMMEITPADGERVEDPKPTKELEKAHTPDLHPEQSRFSLEEIERATPTLIDKKDKPPPPGRFKRLWAHVKRHWMLYGIGGLILLAVFLILL